MYKNKEKQRATERERQRRYRKGVTKEPEGVTEDEGVTASEEKGVTPEEIASGKGLPWYDRPGKPVMDAVTYPDIIDKLTDPIWRGKLEKICASFKASSNPHYAHDVWLGDTNLATVCGYLECTR